ncbi:MAG TPA: hypothetical protein VLH79_07015, partial [Chthonomonadales bacterium]|nr:hypothetical protein [Chthonomonadales bacterium]
PAPSGSGTPESSRRPSGLASSGQRPGPVCVWLRCAAEGHLGEVVVGAVVAEADAATDLRPESAGGCGIPGGKPLHYAVPCPAVTFKIPIDTAAARVSAARIHDLCRSAAGWKPGVSEVFEFSAWSWRAGRLAIGLATQGHAEAAWEAPDLRPARGGPAPEPERPP